MFLGNIGIGTVRIGGYNGKGQQYAYVGIRSLHDTSNDDDDGGDYPRTRRRKYKSHKKPERKPLPRNFRGAESLMRFVARVQTLDRMTEEEFLEKYQQYCQERNLDAASTGWVLTFLTKMGARVAVTGDPTTTLQNIPLKYLGIRKCDMEPKPKMVIASKATNEASKRVSFSTLLKESFGVQQGPQIPPVAPTSSWSSMSGSDNFANHIPHSFLSSPFQAIYLSGPVDWNPGPSFHTNQGVMQCNSNQVPNPAGWNETNRGWGQNRKMFTDKKEEDTIQCHFPPELLQDMMRNVESSFPPNSKSCQKEIATLSETS